MWLVAKLVIVPTHFFEHGDFVRLVGNLIVVTLVWLVVLPIVLVLVLTFELGLVLELEHVPM